MKKGEKMENVTSAHVKGKKVIVRVDYNVPIKDGKIIEAYGYFEPVENDTIDEKDVQQFLYSVINDETLTKKENIKEYYIKKITHSHFLQEARLPSLPPFSHLRTYRQTAQRQEARQKAATRSANRALPPHSPCFRPKVPPPSPYYR